MRINVLLLLLAGLSLVALIFLSSYSGRPDIAYGRIQDNLDLVLQEQKEDLLSFENQLSVYSNLFLIPEVSEISKRVYINGSLVYWNDNKFLGEYSQFKESDSIYIYEYQLGNVILQRREVIAQSDLVEVFSFIELTNDPPVSNQYLEQNINPRIFGDYLVSFKPEGDQMLEFEGRDLFSITLEENSNFKREVISLVFVLIIFVSLILVVFRQRKINLLPGWLYYVLLLGILIGGRTAIWYWSKDHITHWNIFRPINFTAEPIFYSLGDYLFNLAILLTWLLVLYFRNISEWRNDSLQLTEPIKAGLGVLISLAVCFLGFFTYSGLWLILEHSQIQLDIAESIQFGSLRVSAYLIILMVGLNIILLLNLLINIYSKLKLKAAFHYGILLGSYVLFCVFAGSESWVYVGVLIASWILSDLLGFNKRLRLFRYQTFVYMIILIMSFASTCSLAIYIHSEKDDLVAKEKFANRLLIKNDILGELYLSEILKEIENDRFIRTRLFSPLLSRKNIREKIQRQLLSSYFKKYDIDVYLFDDEGVSLQPEINEQQFSGWEQKYRLDSLQTDYENIYLIQDPEDNLQNKYICFLEINAYGRSVGSIVLDLTLKKYIPSSVFPELLLESRYFLSSAEEFDYAVFRNGEILYKQGRFGFENRLSRTDLENSELYNKGTERDGIHYYGLRTQDGRRIVIISSTYSYEALFSNFSFIFLILLFAFGTSLLVGQVFTNSTHFNLSTKIQLYLGLSFVLPLLIVSIALLNTLNQSYREEIDNNFQKRSFNLAENLTDPTESYFESRINIDEYANHIAQAGILAQTDINIYDTRGRLITSSQPEIFRLGLLSNLIDPLAFGEVRYRREQNIITERSIGSLDFKTSYTALRAYDDGALLGILAMPYFDSKNHLRRQQIEVFSSLISIFTIIFLVSIFAGNLIVNNLIRPLKIIGEKLRATSLEEENQPIQYESHDEIGTLIKEYNLMVLKLEESKEALAASQKESAWKEIARQVAHEIKNPLTPMRLKIQRMMTTFSTEDKNYKACETLIDQVDTLSSIADSFSEFAKMPAPKNESVDICKLLDNVAGLYQSERVQIKKKFEKDCPDVRVDPKIFTGIFTNIILNAIQATKNEDLMIYVSVAENSGKVLISIADNGAGIPETLKENIFTPYFSTKSQGSGIGLAVAKKGIENAGGNIWFESEEGKGTTFYISLPVAEGTAS